jgi:hypothetical protein
MIIFSNEDLKNFFDKAADARADLQASVDRFELTHSHAPCEERFSKRA